MSTAIEFSLGTNNSALKSGLSAARSQVESFKDQTRQIFMGLFAGIGIEQLIEKFSRIQDMADTFGTTAEAVQRVDQYAQQFGTNIDAVARAMAKIRSGSGDALEKLGIDAQAFANAGLDGQMLMLSQALEKVDDPQQRINMAFEVLGPRAAAIIPILNAGSEAMKEFFGGASVASNDTVAQIDAAGDKLTELKNKVMVFAADIFGLVDKVMRSIGNGFGSGISMLGNGIGRVGEALKALMSGDFRGVKTAMAASIDDIKNGAAASMESLGKIWSGDQSKSPRKGKGGIEPSMDGASEKAEKARQSLEERIAALRHDHDLKALDAAERLKQLAEERMQLESQLASLGKDKADERKQVEDKIFANEKERLAAEDEQKRADEKAAQDRLEQINKEAAEHEKALKKREKDREKVDEEKMKASFAEREKNLGFVSGVKIAGADQGQQLAGVNYNVINSEAEKGIKLQEEMRNYLKSLDEKKWSVELPDAS